MAELIRATVTPSGVPAGFPILVNNAMQIIEPAFDFLLTLATVPGRSHASETVRTYAEHLYDYFDTLEQNGLDWQQADAELIARYRNRMLDEVSPHTARRYTCTTINQRLRAVSRFYRWAQQRGWLAQSLSSTLTVSAVTASMSPTPTYRPPHGRPSTASVLTVREYERLPRPLSADELRRLFRQLTSPYRLMAEWAVATGMRRKELCALTVYQIPETAHLDGSAVPLIGVALTVTKGERPRTVYPPLRLVDRTHGYIGEQRAVAVRRLGRRLSADDQAALFLNTRGAVSCARATAAFSMAFRRAGLTGSMHWLRHTFALTLLARLQAQTHRCPDLNPLKTLQVLMGHASIQTTGVYLRCVELHAESIAESIEFLYGAAVPDG